MHLTRGVHYSPPCKGRKKDSVHVLSNLILLDKWFKQSAGAQRLGDVHCSYVLAGVSLLLLLLLLLLLQTRTLVGVTFS